MKVNKIQINKIDDILTDGYKHASLKEAIKIRIIDKNAIPD